MTMYDLEHPSAVHVFCGINYTSLCTSTPYKASLYIALVPFSFVDFAFLPAPSAPVLHDGSLTFQDG